jgi:hypothetical protein
MVTMHETTSFLDVHGLSIGLKMAFLECVGKLRKIPARHNREADTVANHHMNKRELI